MATPTQEQEIEARHIFCARIRDYARDVDVLNTMISGEEHSNRYIWDAIEEVLEDFNISPPPVGTFLVANFPNVTLLRDGVMAVLLDSATLLYARNDVMYAHGGTTVQLPQVSTYTQLADRFRERYEMKKDRLKVAINMQQAVAATSGIWGPGLMAYRPVLAGNYMSADVFGRGI